MTNFKFKTSKKHLKALKSFKQEPFKVKIIAVYEDGTTQEMTGTIVSVQTKGLKAPVSIYKNKFVCNFTDSDIDTGV